MTEPAPAPTDTGCLIVLKADELAIATVADIVLTKLHEVADQITRRNGRIT